VEINKGIFEEKIDQYFTKEYAINQSLAGLHYYEDYFLVCSHGKEVRSHSIPNDLYDCCYSCCFNYDDIPNFDKGNYLLGGTSLVLLILPGFVINEGM